MSNPRIISGVARGVRLKAVPGDITRPITDRVKEALFNIIGQDIFGASMLDLFAGTGSVGIEALSRGASRVILNDIHPAAIKTIRENLAHTKLEDNGITSKQDAFTFLRKYPTEQFDYIFIAPPQYKSLWLEILIELDQQPGWLAENGWVIVQIDPVEAKELTLSNFSLFDTRRYGSTLLLFLEKQAQ